jgi:S-adenosylmethionine hydrolase
MAIITLTTDFGTDDEYAGLMKAAILSINQSATIVDISHGIDAQDVVQAAFMVESAFPYFPKGTIHVVVVDPGVGTDRAIVGVEAFGHFFIAPDNGIPGMVLESTEPETAVRLENRTFSLDRISATFHGRDIMAPAAAHLSLGVPLSRMGRVIAAGDLVAIEDLRASLTPEGKIEGRVIAIDRFGNLVTNISIELLRSAGFRQPEDQGAIRILLANRHEIDFLSRYADAVSNGPLALIGSRGYLEIAVNNGSAHKFFAAGKTTSVRVDIAG